jgi:hypothetical protein
MSSLPSSKILSSSSAFIQFCFVLPCSTHRDDPYGRVAHRVEHDPYPIAQESQQRKSLLGTASRRDHHPVFVIPKHLSFFEVDFVLLFVGVAFRRIILELHGIFSIPQEEELRKSVSWGNQGTGHFLHRSLSTVSLCEPEADEPSALPGGRPPPPPSPALRDLCVLRGSPPLPSTSPPPPLHSASLPDLRASAVPLPQHPRSNIQDPRSQIPDSPWNQKSGVPFEIFLLPSLLGCPLLRKFSSTAPRS